MAFGIRTPGFKLVCEADGLEIDLLPLQGLWTEGLQGIPTSYTGCSTVVILQRPHCCRALLCVLMWYVAQNEELGQEAMQAFVEKRPPVFTGRCSQVGQHTSVTMWQSRAIVPGVIRRGEGPCAM